MKIAYEPHPVTPERKAELRAEGFKIIDAAFAPAETPKPARKSKKAEAAAEEAPTETPEE